MATEAKKINKLVLGPTATEKDKEIALSEITARLNLLIDAVNTLISEAT